MTRKPMSSRLWPGGLAGLMTFPVPVSAIAASRAAVAFVAFYEGASRVRGVAGAIRQFAEVVRVSRVLRRDLPDLTWPGRDVFYHPLRAGPGVSVWE